jgi:diguanylate cyclase
LPIDILKIDQSFTESLDQHAPDRQRGASFARAILSLGQSLQLRTIAEGVETPRQAALLTALGCPLAQGFLYAEPACASEITQYLARAQWLTVSDGYPAAA